MPTSREHRAQRLMQKSQLADLKMPKFVLKTSVPPVKEDELYPIKWPTCKSSDVQTKINEVLGPLSLFAPYSHENVEPEPEIVLERPVTPINEEIKSQPLTFNKLASYVRRRITAQKDVPYLTTDDQQDLAAIIMGEVIAIWPDIRRQIDDPFLSVDENKELNRRIAVHIVTVCEKLFHHYLHKAQILNERGVFSGPANASRLKTQLALDADKFLNILTIRRYLVADMRGKAKESVIQSQPPKTPKHESKPLTFTSMIQSSRPKSEFPEHRVLSIEQDLKEIAEAMPYLDTDKLVDIVASLPDRSVRTPSDGPKSSYGSLFPGGNMIFGIWFQLLGVQSSVGNDDFSTSNWAFKIIALVLMDLALAMTSVRKHQELKEKLKDYKLTLLQDNKSMDESPPDPGQPSDHSDQDQSQRTVSFDHSATVCNYDEDAPPSQISEAESHISGTLIKDLASHQVMNLKRAKSHPVLHTGETLLEELGIQTSVRDDALLTNELTILKQDRLSMAKAKENVVTKSKLGSPNFLSEDLKQLMMEKDESGVDISGDDDLPPLLQAITRHARHDNMREKLAAQLKELEEKEKRRRESELIDVQAPTHPQPATVSTKIGKKMVVRTSDIRVSERVCLSSITLNRYATVYNDLIEEIDPVTVKNLDKNLFLSDEIHEVYHEIMKTVPTDHLNLDFDDIIVPAPESVNVTGTMASASLSRKFSQRVINPNLYHQKLPPWGQQDQKSWVKTPTNPPKNLQGEDIFASLTPNIDRVQEVLRNPPKVTQMMTTSANMPTDVTDKMSRAYASWLQWWKSTVTSDDYMKYLSTRETDYMGLIFHFYDSEEAESEDEDMGPVQGHRSRRTKVSKQMQEQREQERQLDELRAIKSEYKEGLWNANCILMGGLGKDPAVQDEKVEISPSSKPQDTGHSSAKTLQERALLARQAKEQLQRRQQNTMSDSNNNRKWTIISRSSIATLDAALSEGSKEEEDKEIQKSEPQERLEYVWNSLHMPDALRLDMAIKYSCAEFFSKLTEAIERWEYATNLILRRETLLVKLEKFERSASDPNRFFAKENGVKRSSVVLLEEARCRSSLYKKIESLDADIKTELDYIKVKFKDIVSFKGRPYEDKMKWDRTEMLHWLQEERKQNGLRYEALLQHIPLKTALLEPISGSVK